MNDTLLINTNVYVPELSAWHCELFGMGNRLTIRPEKGKVPGWFWRIMQYLILGNRWIKDNES